MFDAVEEALDEVALAIEPCREGERALAICLGRNVGPGLALFRLGADCSKPPASAALREEGTIARLRS